MPSEPKPSHNPFSSASLVVYESLRNNLIKTLRKHNLNSTQYRLLLHIFDHEGELMQVQELAIVADLAPNLVAHATSCLSDLGFLKKISSQEDARVKRVVLTDEGRKAIGLINNEIRTSLLRWFNPQDDPNFFEILTRGLKGGSYIGGLWSDDLIEQYPSSTTPIIIDMLLQKLDVVLKKEEKVSLSEARIMQRLFEVGEPMRGVDLSFQLSLPPTTITRAAKRLEDKGLLVRMLSPENLRAVFFNASEKGRDAQRSIIETMETTGNKIYWDKLENKNIQDIIATEKAFYKNMQSIDEERKRQMLASLEIIN